MLKDTRLQQSSINTHVDNIEFPTEIHEIERQMGRPVLETPELRAALDPGAGEPGDTSCGVGERSHCKAKRSPRNKRMT